MRREPKLSNDNELDLKFIAMFTVGFVVIASILMVAGYVVLSAAGILGQGQAETNVSPTPAASPTRQPTAIAIGVSATPIPPEPTVWITPSPSPSPSPTPVPSPYKLGVNLGTERAGSMIYYLTFWALPATATSPASEPLDMSQVTLTIKDWETTYCSYDYNGMMYWLDGNWSNDNGDKRLDPIGEKLKFEISAYSLKIPLDRETKLYLTIGDTQVFYMPIPKFQNEVDTGGTVDYSGTIGGSGTGSDPWISDSFDPSSYNEIDWDQYFKDNGG